MGRTVGGLKERLRDAQCERKDPEHSYKGIDARIGHGYHHRQLQDILLAERWTPPSKFRGSAEQSRQSIVSCSCTTKTQWRATRNHLVAESFDICLCELLALAELFDPAIDFVFHKRRQSKDNRENEQVKLTGF